MKQILNFIQKAFLLIAVCIICCSCEDKMPINGSLDSYPRPDGKEYRILEKIPIEPIWSGTRVGYCLLTYENYQFVAYYDANRQMTIAQRTLDSKEWQYKKLPSYIGWDSHNSITLGVDKEGYLHVSGNMHAIPLVYFRASKPYDVSSLVQIESMVGLNEGQVTYPVFMRNKNNDLIFNHRDGTSGSGKTYYNIYDTATKTWSRLLDEPILDGQGDQNAYSSSAPILGPDGWYHLSWVWRDSPMAETNHDLSYAKSQDLINWFTADNQPITLPITPSTEGVIVDPIPIKQGMLNGNGKIGFDSQNRVILAYHKFDDYNNLQAPTQLYNARFEDGQWKIYQATDWNYRWYFSGAGTLSLDVNIEEVIYKNGELRQVYSYKGKGSGLLILSEENLQIQRIDPQTIYPYDIKTIRSEFANMGIRITLNTIWKDGGANSNDVYLLRHESLPSNNDEAWPEPWPESNMLELYKLIEE